MNYRSIINLFLTSDPLQWKRVSGNHDYAFCETDVNLRIVSTVDGEDIQQEDFREAWANGFPASRATGYFYNLYYGSTLIHRFILVSVDSGSALLPAPLNGTTEVTQAQAKAAQIFDTTNSLVEYLQRAGLRVGSNPGM